MKLRITAGLLVLSLAAGGCGKGSAEQSSTISTNSTVRGGVIKSKVKGKLTQAQINASLFVASDLPFGFVNDDDSSPLPPTGCRALDDLEMTTDRAVPHGKVRFMKDTIGTSLQESLSVQPDADAKFKTLTHTFNQCGSFTATASDGTTMAMTSSPLSVSKLGDDTFAVRMGGSSGFGTIAMDIVLVRAGSNFLYVRYVQLGGTDASVTEAFARTAMNKMNAAA